MKLHAHVGRPGPRAEIKFFAMLLHSKKLICGVLACLFLLAACDSGQDGPAPFEAEETTQALLDSGAFSEQLELLDNEIAHMLFGFDSWSEADLIQGSMVYYSTGATSELCAVLVVGEEYYGGDMAAARNSLEEWLAGQIEAERDYRPAEVEKLERAILEERGNTILLVVAADREKAQDAIPAG